MNWKSLMLSAGVLLAGSTALVACGDDGDAPCEVDADCADGEVCIGLQGARECEILCTSDDECTEEGEACIQVPDVNPDGATVCDPIELTEDSCSTDADCTAPSTCVDGFCQVPAECTSDADCTSPDVCVEGACVAPSTETCESTADCIADTAYCATVGAQDTCLDISCGSSLNSCGRGVLGPKGGARDANGPVIFFPEQVGSCSQDPNQCLPGAAPYVCEFSFLAFDDNLATSGLNSKINVISRSGSRLTVFGGRSTASGNNTQYNFKACFPETSSGNIGTAVVLADSANDDSQTLCVDGTL